jgi:glycosyltransferase involved in cell wall biosynthesis
MNETQHSSEGQRKLITIIMPAYNEESNLPRAYEEVTDLFVKLLPSYDYEVLLIDNCSVDRTGEICQGICAKDSHWRYIRFSRNFSSEISITAGLHYSRGDAVIILFSDLQDPPEVIPQFVEKWKQGYDVVCGLLMRRDDGAWWKGVGAGIAYRLLRNFTDIHIPSNVTDYRLMARPVVNAINKLEERNRYFRGLAHWVGFKSTTVEYSRRPRTGGKSNAPFWYLLDFTARALTSFSIVPLRAFFLFGLGIMGCTCVYAAVTAMLWLWGETVPGLTTIYLLLFAILGVLSLGIGTLGEYIGRIYIETKRRPLWIVADSRNIAMPAEQFYGD